jgi:hypothetical protein
VVRSTKPLLQLKMLGFESALRSLRKRSFAQLSWRGEPSYEHLFSMSRRVEDYPSGTDRICDAAEILQPSRSRIYKQDRKISIVAGSDRA